MAVAQRLLVSMSCEAGTPHWTLLTAVLLLGSLLGIVSAYPLPSSRTNATSLEKRWETLFSRSVLGISGEKPDLNWESDYLLGIKRVRRLYCNVGIGFHLQILPDGRINGVHNENQYSEFYLHRCNAIDMRDGQSQYAWICDERAPMPSLFICMTTCHSTLREKLNIFHGKRKRANLLNKTEVSIRIKHPISPSSSSSFQLDHDMNVWTLLDTTYFYAAL